MLGMCSQKRLSAAGLAACQGFSLYYGGVTDHRASAGRFLAQTPRWITSQTIIIVAHDVFAIDPKRVVNSVPEFAKLDKGADVNRTNMVSTISGSERRRMKANLHDQRS